MFPSNAAAAKRLGKRKVREVETFNPHFASTSTPVDRRRSHVHKLLNNAAAAAPLSYMALLTANDDVDDNDNIMDQSDQINQIITYHNEKLRQSVVGMVEETVAKRVKAQAERNEELERLAAMYKGEAERLLARVRYLEHAVMSLSEGLQEANAAGHYAEAVEEEGESSFEDPDRVGPVRLDCKVCERELANMMVWPCRHVCVCKRCDAAAKCCPVCGMVKTTSVEVCLPLD
ncbi:BOI-related E3 ubiquitin-protein ligase 1-like [Salvia hispanica]|uniref:BOI-related E3 ubiquitin-protein ligase 1-like n=1 Tax=Salvia hispanica TaxID=49212 RepID=UPI002008FC0D|nr:BOI-related E3 ubiquitin-protein ligase 1-like [Salvia hispanica]